MSSVIKTALIVGASHGLGQRLVHEFASRGVTITGTVRDTKHIEIKTDLGDQDALLDVHTGVSAMVEVLNADTGKAEHQFLDYQGKTLPWLSRSVSA